MDALAIFNSFEAVFWITIGVIVFCRRRGRLGIVAAFWFVLFGISDIIEVFTGAWYRPLSLLLFKGVCIFALVTCGLTHRRQKKLDQR